MFYSCNLFFVSTVIQTWWWVNYAL